MLENIMKKEAVTKRNLLLGGVAALAVVAVVSGIGQNKDDVVVDAELLIETDVDDGVKMGEVKVFHFPNVIDLESDRGNLSINSHVQLPPGYVVENVEFIIHEQKHTVTYSHQIDQPKSVSISQASIVKISSQADFALGTFTGKKTFKAALEVKKAADELRHSFVLDATSHARVKYSGWADGRKYSSKDGVIRASLEVTARRVPTDGEVDQALTTLAANLSDANASTMKEAVKAIKGIKAAADPVAKTAKA